MVRGEVNKVYSSHTYP